MSQTTRKLAALFAVLVLSSPTALARIDRAATVLTAGDASPQSAENKKCQLPDNNVRDNRLSLSEFIRQADELTCGDAKRAQAIVEAGEATVAVLSVYDPVKRKFVDGGMTEVDLDGKKTIQESYVGSGTVYGNRCFVTTSGHLVGARIGDGEVFDPTVSPVGYRVEMQRYDRFGNLEKLLGTVVMSLRNPNNVHEDAALIELDKPTSVSRALSPLAKGVKVAKEGLFTSSYSLDLQNGVMPKRVVIDPNCMPNMERIRAKGSRGQIFTLNCKASSAGSGGSLSGVVVDQQTGEPIAFPMIGILSEVDERVRYRTAIGISLVKGNLVAIDVSMFGDAFKEIMKERLAIRRSKGDNQCPAEVE